MTRKIIYAVAGLLLAVWAFVVGGYFHQGWVKPASMPFPLSFLIGGVAMVIVMLGMGIFLYLYLQKNSPDSALNTAVLAPAFFMIFFTVLAMLNYQTIQEDRFFSDYEFRFKQYHRKKYAAYGIEIDEFEKELRTLCFESKMAVKRLPDVEMDKILELKSNEKVFGKKSIIHKTCIRIVNGNEFSLNDHSESFKAFILSF